MATCNNCVHSGICAIQLEPHYVLDRAQKLIRESNNVEHECLCFKARSRFVELPCKAGDTVYYITNVNGKNKINSAIVDEVAIYKSGTIGYDCGVGEIGFSSKSIGKRVFLTQTEAEQALKERESE